MVKQKVVMKLPLADAKKRTKALKTAVGMPGVISAAVDGDRITVVGDGLDPIGLTTMLRKRVGNAEIVSVTTGDEKKKESESEGKGGAKSMQPENWPYYLYTVQPHPYTPVVPENNYDPSCNIM